jgi:uncharacterized membrane protein
MDRTRGVPVGVLVLRVVLSLAVAAVLGVVAVATASYLAAVAVVGGVAVVVGSGGSLVVPVLAVVGLLGAAAAVLVVLGVARRADRALVAAATPPSPVERARHEYVHDEIDEREFEHRVERAFADERRGDARRWRRRR